MMKQETETDRLKRVRAQAGRVFGNADKADRWLRRPLQSLDGQRPIEAAENAEGACAIAKLLDKIAWGAAA